MEFWILLFLMFSKVEAAPASPAFPFSGDTYYQKLNSGWPKVMKPVERKIRADRNYILVSMLAPSFAFDLRSLEQFRTSVLGTTESRGSVGHFMLGWQCHRNGTLVKGFAGQSGGKYHQLSKMFLGGWGYTALLASLTDGFLHGKERLDELLLDRSFWDQRPPLYSLLVEVGDEECDKLLGFLRGYLDHPTRPVHNYGAVLDPLKFEGANCLSFTGAMLGQSGLFKEHYPLWWRKIQVPHSLLGRRRSPLPVYTNVPAWIMRRAEQVVTWADVLLWSYDDEGPMKEVSTLDPEMVLLTIRTAYETVMKSNLKDEDQDRWGKLVRYIDTGSRPAISKHSPDWASDRTEVNRRYDGQANKVFLTTKQWMKNKRFTSFEITDLGDTPVLILRK